MVEQVFPLFREKLARSSKLKLLLIRATKRIDSLLREREREKKVLVRKQPLTHVILADILDEYKDVVIKDGELEMRVLFDLVSVLGQGHVDGLVSRVQDLDLGVIVFRQVKVTRHTRDARWAWEDFIT